MNYWIILYMFIGFGVPLGAISILLYLQFGYIKCLNGVIASAEDVMKAGNTLNKANNRVIKAQDNYITKLEVFARIS